jgi:hypothetical protein
MAAALGALACIGGRAHAAPMTTEAFVDHRRFRSRLLLTGGLL